MRGGMVEGERLQSGPTRQRYKRERAAGARGPAGRGHEGERARDETDSRAPGVSGNARWRSRLGRAGVNSGLGRIEV
jgi:ribosomal protein L15